MSGHKGFINDVSFESTEGSVVASVGDDCRCRLWSEEFSQQTEFTLQSPGMSVSFNPLEPNKVFNYCNGIHYKAGLFEIGIVDQREVLSIETCTLYPQCYFFLLLSSILFRFLDILNMTSEGYHLVQYTMFQGIGSRS